MSFALLYTVNQRNRCSVHDLRQFGFALESWLMHSFTYPSSLSDEQMRFNHRLSRAGCAVKNDLRRMNRDGSFAI